MDRAAPVWGRCMTQSPPRQTTPFLFVCVNVLYAANPPPLAATSPPTVAGLLQCQARSLSSIFHQKVREPHGTSTSFTHAFVLGSGLSCTPIRQLTTPPPFSLLLLHDLAVSVQMIPRCCCLCGGKTDKERGEFVNQIWWGCWVGRRGWRRRSPRNLKSDRSERINFFYATTAVCIAWDRSFLIALSNADQRTKPGLERERSC